MVTTAAAGLHLLMEDQIDGAVLDINLGDGMVFVLADELTERGIPFVFATAYDELLPDRFLKAKRCIKPYDPADVADMLR